MTEQKDCPHGYWICEDRPGGIVRQRCRYCGFTKDIANPFILPDNYADVLITSHALGWKLEDELWEFERVVKKGGFIIHCPGTADEDGDEYVHYRLISPDWQYDFSGYRESDGWKRKYWKQL